MAYARTFVLVALSDAVLGSLVSLHLLTVLLLEPTLGRDIAVIVFLRGLDVLSDTRDLGRAAVLGSVVAWRQVSQSRSGSEQL